MNARLRTALRNAAYACQATATRIRKELPEDDGDPEARIVTPDGCTEADAAEWDEDARLIEEHIKEATRA